VTETAGGDRPARPVRRRRPRVPVLEGPARASAHVCQAASCLSAQSDQVFDALADQVTQAGLTDVAVKPVGCLGLCAAGPLVEVPESGQLFQRVVPGDLGGLVEALRGVTPGATPARSTTATGSRPGCRRPFRRWPRSSSGSPREGPRGGARGPS
jgi:(2Fe-2S) ferredoxin